MGSRFIVLDGPDGCGKTTQARLLVNALEQAGVEVMHTHEPGGTPAGERIRQVLLDPATGELDPLTEALLFCADRAQHVSTVIKPALDQGKTVVCDRFASSTAVYQGYAGGLGFEPAQRLNDIATGGLQPDLLIVLDIDLAHARERMDEERLDRIEQYTEDFHDRVRQGFIEYARLLGERAVVVDGNQPVDEVHEEIMQIIESGWKPDPRAK